MDFSERVQEKGKEREKNINVREEHQSVAFRTYPTRD